MAGAEVAALAEPSMVLLLSQNVFNYAGDAAPNPGSIQEGRTKAYQVLQFMNSGDDGPQIANAIAATHTFANHAEVGEYNRVVCADALASVERGELEFAKNTLNNCLITREAPAEQEGYFQYVWGIVLLAEGQKSQAIEQFQHAHELWAPAETAAKVDKRLIDFNKLTLDTTRIAATKFDMEIWAILCKDEGEPEDKDHPFAHVDPAIVQAAIEIVSIVAMEHCTVEEADRIRQDRPVLHEIRLLLTGDESMLYENPFLKLNTATTDKINAILALKKEKGCSVKDAIALFDLRINDLHIMHGLRARFTEVEDENVVEAEAKDFEKPLDGLPPKLASKIDAIMTIWAKNGRLDLEGVITQFEAMEAEFAEGNQQGDQERETDVVRLVPATAGSATVVRVVSYNVNGSSANGHGSPSGAAHPNGDAAANGHAYANGSRASAGSNLHAAAQLMQSYINHS